MKCENRRSDGSAIIAPACYGKQATRSVEIRYHPRPFGGGYESDTHNLCDECAARITRDAKGHGYDVVTRRVK